MIPDELRTTNLLLRPYREHDGAAVYAYWKSDPGWERFNESVPAGFTEQDADDFVARMRGRDRREQPHWALVHEGDVVGVVSLTFEPDRLAALIGYGIHGDLRGRGLVAESVVLVLDSAFSSYPGLQAIRAHTDPGNRPSIRVLEKMGFSREEIESSDTPSAQQSTHDATFCLRRSVWNDRNNDVQDDRVASGVPVEIVQIRGITEEVRRLAEVATAEGHNNVATLVREFESGGNQFRKAGEGLFGAYENERLLGVCGLNVDPYESSEPAARVRRLYVLPAARRHGVASQLMAQIEALAAQTFSRIQLFTDSQAAGEFYVRLGYSPVERHKVSHEKRL